jgi:Mg-chelatase subunit ChlD
MMIVVFTYYAWIYWSPINTFFGQPLPSFPVLPALLLNTLVYIPVMYFTIKRWLYTMTRRRGGPAAGIDVVERGRALPEKGDQWGTATRPYEAEEPSKIIGSKSDIRDPRGIDAAFFVKLPDLDEGEEVFDREELLKRAMIRSTVSSGGWINKRAASRSMGTLKSSDSAKQGRPVRARVPIGEITSIDLPATIRAALGRQGYFDIKEGLKIQHQDIRESVFSGRTPLTVIVVIDVSMSMKEAINSVKETLRRIESETRGSRDRIGVIAFKDSGAVEVQVPTSNWNKVYRALSRLKISGLSPLAESLMKAIETIRREKMRNENIEPLVILISDFAANIPLAQSVGPGQARYTPIRDLVKAARLLKKENIRISAINVNRSQVRWVKFLKRPYHEALELAVTLRMRKEGLYDVIETILAVPEFRKSFGAFLISRIGGGRCYLHKEIMDMQSVLGSLLAANVTRSKLKAEELKKAEEYISIS